MLFSAIAVAVVGLFASSMEASPIHHTGLDHTGFNHTGFNHTGFNHTLSDTNGTFCGNRTFNPHKYHCFHGDILCPRINGTRTAPCGTKENYNCYNVAHYKCANGTLIEYPNFNHTHHKLNSTAPAKKGPHSAHLKF
ncbi:hypothetical protein RUND412_007154 [Rhizina undulata]